jgi:hypothetical protein
MAFVEADGKKQVVLESAKTEPRDVKSAVRPRLGSPEKLCYSGFIDLRSGEVYLCPNANLRGVAQPG